MASAYSCKLNIKNVYHKKMDKYSSRIININVRLYQRKKKVMHTKIF